MTAARQNDDRAVPTPPGGNERRNERRKKPSLIERVHDRMFDAIYSRALVYNTCWEDPAVDRIALDLHQNDTVLVITSAGCNALDYVLAGAGRVLAIDANPRQNALLELKLAGIRALEYEDFFALFGFGRHTEFEALYRSRLRPQLSPFARQFWDKHWHWFTHRGVGQTFYSHGLAGQVGRVVRGYSRLKPALAHAIADLLSARSLEAQRAIYDERAGPLMWNAGVKWTLDRQFTMSLLGVPHPQRAEVERQHAGGVAAFVRSAVDYVFRELPLARNYFWQLYMRGHYTRDCCPEYLKPHGFARLQSGLHERVELHTALLTEFLSECERPIDKFVLLDHMDWMAGYRPQALAEEWEWILQRAAPGARAIFRSAHTDPAYLDTTWVNHGGERRALRDWLALDPHTARELSRQDRVHTYAGFHIANALGAGRFAAA
ncbi:MAG: BtaA family protein [Proteobacteria bacterium]|nr:BtaA family protein [Burkholderiales bacterium]